MDWTAGHITRTWDFGGTVLHFAPPERCSLDPTDPIYSGWPRRSFGVEAWCCMQSYGFPMHSVVLCGEAHDGIWAHDGILGRPTAIVSNGSLEVVLLYLSVLIGGIYVN